MILLLLYINCPWPNFICNLPLHTAVLHGRNTDRRCKDRLLGCSCVVAAAAADVRVNDGRNSVSQRARRPRQWAPRNHIQRLRPLGRSWRFPPVTGGAAEASGGITNSQIRVLVNPTVGLDTRYGGGIKYWLDVWWNKHWRYCGWFERFRGRGTWKNVLRAATAGLLQSGCWRRNKHGIRTWCDIHSWFTQLGWGICSW